MLGSYVPVRALKHPAPHRENRNDVKFVCTDESNETTHTTSDWEDRNDVKFICTDDNAETTHTTSSDREKRNDVKFISPSKSLETSYNTTLREQKWSDVKCTCTDNSFETSPTITPHRENRSDAKCTRTDRSAGTWRRLCLLCASDVWSAPLSTLPGCSWRLRSSSAQRHRKTDIRTCISAFLNALNPTQNSRVVWKSRWPSWAPVPNKPTVSVDVKQHFNQLDPSMTHVWSLKCCTWIIAKVCSQFALHSSL